MTGAMIEDNLAAARTMPGLGSRSSWNGADATLLNNAWRLSGVL